MAFPQALSVLKSHSLPSLVQEELERLILDGTLAPGEPLREVALAAQLGVSRGPIREAFRALEEKGLVRVVKNVGVHVRELDLVEADQIYEVREVLEVMIGEKVAATLDAPGEKALKKIIADMERAVAAADVGRYTALNLAFHDTLASLSGNHKLHAAYNRLVAELSLFRRQTYIHDQGTMEVSLGEHKTILDAVIARKPAQAAELLRRHAADSRRRLHQVLAPTSSSESKQGR